MTKLLLAAVAAIALAAPARAAAPPPQMPPGTYSVAGVFTKTTGGSCALVSGPVSGVMLFPGDSNQSLALTLTAANTKTGPQLLIFTAFPPVPGAGLNGWATGPNFMWLNNGVLLDTGDTAKVTFKTKTIFALAPVPTLATIAIVSGQCNMTLTGTLLRVGDYQNW